MVETDRIVFVMPLCTCLYVPSLSYDIGTTAHTINGSQFCCIPILCQGAFAFEVRTDEIFFWYLQTETVKLSKVRTFYFNLIDSILYLHFVKTSFHNFSFPQPVIWNECQLDAELFGYVIYKDDSSLYQISYCCVCAQFIISYTLHSKGCSFAVRITLYQTITTFSYGEKLLVKKINYANGINKRHGTMEVKGHNWPFYSDESLAFYSWLPISCLRFQFQPISVENDASQSAIISHLILRT